MTSNKIINNIIVSLKSLKKYDEEDNIDTISLSFKIGNEKLEIGITEDGQFYYNSLSTNYKNKFISQIKAQEIIRDAMFPASKDAATTDTEYKIIEYFISHPETRLYVEDLEKRIKVYNVGTIINNLTIKGILNYWDDKYSLADIDPEIMVNNKTIDMSTWRRKILVYLKKRIRPATIGDILNFAIKSDNLYRDREYIITILNELVKEKKIVKNGQTYFRK